MGRRGRPRHPGILTPREWEVLELLRQRLSNGQIAERLGITLDGAKYHVSQILSKLEVGTREEAASLALEKRRQRWASWPPWVRIAGAGTVATTAAGIVLLTWAAVQTARPTKESPGLAAQDIAGDSGPTTPVLIQALVTNRDGDFLTVSHREPVSYQPLCIEDPCTVRLLSTTRVVGWCDIPVTPDEIRPGRGATIWGERGGDNGLIFATKLVVYESGAPLRAPSPFTASECPESDQ